MDKATEKSLAQLNIIYHFRVRGVGAERVHIAGIANAFRAHGHVVIFVSPSGIDPTAPEAITHAGPALQSPIIKLLHFLADNLPQCLFEVLEILYNLFSFFSLGWTTMKRRPDFIYERYAFFNLAGAIVSSLTKTPLIIEVNELAGYERVRKQSFTWLAKKIEKFIFSRANIVSTVSDFLTEHVRETTQHKIKVITLPNGVDRQWTQIPPRNELEELRKTLNIEEGRKVICFVGGLVPWHNFDFLLKGIQLLKRKFNTVTLLIVGDGPLRSYIESQANELAIQDCLCMAGQISYNNVKAFIAASDVAVIPETNEFRSPIKMFEYMSMAKPVVAPRKPAIEAVINDGAEGFLFDSGNIESFYEKLLGILENTKKAEAVGEAARKKILQSFLWDNHTEKLIKEWTLSQKGQGEAHC